MPTPDEIFTDEMQPAVDRFAVFCWHYKKLKRHRLDCFDDHGRVIMVDPVTEAEELKDGRAFVLEVIAFFEREDKACFYLFCAELMSLLTEYDSSFG